jgi:C-terminal processing protease CtpA/Prc
VIDTGSGSALTLHSPFVAAHQLQQRFHTVGEMVVGRGVGGYVRGFVARGGDLMLGSTRIHSPLVLLSTDTGGASASQTIDGNIGGAILASYAVTFDYERHDMYLRGPVGVEHPTNFSRTGLFAVRDDSRFYLVIDVLAKGPAASAGMKAGDRIVAIDGKPATGIEGEAWRAIVSGPPGTSHSMTLERDAKQLEVTLTLRDLI